MMNSAHILQHLVFCLFVWECSEPYLPTIIPTIVSRPKNFPSQKHRQLRFITFVLWLQCQELFEVATFHTWFASSWCFTTSWGTDPKPCFFFGNISERCGGLIWGGYKIWSSWFLWCCLGGRYLNHIFVFSSLKQIEVLFVFLLNVICGDYCMHRNEWERYSVSWQVVLQIAGSFKECYK